jgi:three-Cys-motif partner protein
MEPSMFGDDNGSEDEHAFGGVWTLIKLEVLERYLVAFNNARSKQSFTRIYVDAFAGTGRCDVTVNGEKVTVDGSARRALKINPPFGKFCFIELKARKLAALKALQTEFPDKSIEIIQDGANIALKTICERYDCRNSRAVLFLDPFGMHVEWLTLEAIAKTGAIDVWYLFPDSSLYRQAGIGNSRLGR